MLSIKNDYYVADVPIWTDIINPAGIREWADGFSGELPSKLSHEEREELRAVRAAVGGYVVLLNRGEGKSGWVEVERVLREVGRVTSVSEGDGWEGVCLGVLLGSSAGEDDEGWVEGFEVVDGTATGKSEIGEAVGMERVREALEANEWAAAEGGVEELEDELGFGEWDVEGGFEIGEDDVEGMRRPLFGGDAEEEEEGVEGLEALMLKMQAMRGEFCDGSSGYVGAG